MSSNEHQYTIVVGVDGSPSSKAALRWAAWHAGLVGGSITAIMVWDLPMIYNWEVPGPQDFAHNTATTLSTVIDEVLGDTSPVEIHKEVAQGHPARALLDAADETRADLIVVGNRGHGGFTEALLGSVSQHVVHHAHCPVVIVREPAET
ncbi:universal stress protein [Saccharopolyspora phatthalungensis]|uniref:Nucleotide-binding universal stress UspA family protein n=1 Tax=Saccharopolyspora phatthalungensis TaxID=664693 RepID=A0A840QC69_9PSEU|nr:universal stress protein [Saccharopolyspora phatthalungensis]MBB5157557.1 nucleotide-binding universal stress UspA family protein [Saccharopolyspora phatthalungensis]